MASTLTNDSMDREMSDNQRRFFCRLLFLFFCCLPTAIIVYRAAHPQTPEFWQRSIQSELGLATQIVDIETPAPNETVLRGLTLLGNDGQPILSAIETRLRFEKDHNELQIKERVRLTARGLTELADRLNERMTRSGAWSIRLEDVEVIGAQLADGSIQTVALSPVEIAILPDPASGNEVTDAVVKMGVNGQIKSYDQLVECNFRCFKDPAATKIDVETGGNEVPCWLVEGWVPQLAELGPRATFQGRIGIDPVSQKNIGRVKGFFEQVALPAETSAISTVATAPQKLGAIKVDISYDDSSRQRVAQGQPLEITALLLMPDGSELPMVPEYHFHQVLEVGSAISNTVRAARTRSAINR